MTVGAGHRNVPAGKGKSPLLVARQRERGWPVSVQRVALFASIEVRGGGKLSGMAVGVAVGAVLKLYFE